MRVIQLQEIIRLKQRVRELREADAVVTILKARADGFLRHHNIHRKMLPHIPKKLDKAELAEPIVVIHNNRCVVPLEVEQTAQLLFDPNNIPFHIRRRKKLPFR